MMNHDRLLVIGLDGATFDLIYPWAEAGHLPTLARLMDSGTHGPLRSVPNMNSAPAWTTFATGKNPGKHGIFYFDEHVPGRHERRFLAGADRDGLPFWRILSDAGYRVGLINIPMTYPADAVNGFIVAGEDAPRLDSPGFTYPPDLVHQLRTAVGDYIIDHAIWALVKTGRRDLAVDRLHEAISKRVAWARHLMANQPWDLAVVVFTETDAAHHLFWRDMDEGDPVYGRVILDIYRHLDAACAELMAAAPTASVMIMSDHGGGFNQRGAEFLNPWLQEMGYQVAKPPTNQSSLAVSAVRRLYRALELRLDRDTKRLLMRLFPGLRERIEATMRSSTIDWSRTRAYSDGMTDEIWINLLGREPKGIVHPGEEYEALRREIIAALYATRDMITGEPVVEWAKLREEVYHGPHIPRAPDIIIRWRTSFIINGLQNPGHRSVKEPPGFFSSGGHRPNGIIIASGPTFRQSGSFPGADLQDLAPTFLYLFNVPIPEDMDGRVITEMINPDLLAARPIRHQGHAGGRGEGHVYTPEEADTIAERLRGLGYIE